MTEGKSTRIVKRRRGLIKARRTDDLKEALRVWAAEFNRKAKTRGEHARRAKASSSRREATAQR
jgi:hypothetical protein